MNKISKTIAIFLLICVTLFSLNSAIASYTGDTDFGKSIMGQNYQKVRTMFATGTIGQEVPTGGLFPIAVSDGTNNRAAKSDTNGELQVDVLTIADISFGVTKDSSTAPEQLAAVAVFDGTNYRAPKSDSDGELQVDILTIAAGDNNIGNVDLASARFEVVKGSSDAPTRLAAVATYDGTNYQALKSDSSGELQIDILTIAAGDNNIGNVDIASASFGVTKDSTDAPSQLAAVAVYDGTTYRAAKGDANGELQIDILTIAAGDNNIGNVGIASARFEVVNGSSVPPGRLAAIAVYDGTNYQDLKSDPNGELQIDILTIAAGDNNIGNVDIASASFGTTENTTDAPSQVAIVGGKTFGGVYDVMAINSSRQPIVELGAITVTTSLADVSATGTAVDGMSLVHGLAASCTTTTTDDCYVSIKDGNAGTELARVYTPGVKGTTTYVPFVIPVGLSNGIYLELNGPIRCFVNYKN